MRGTTLYICTVVLLLAGCREADIDRVKLTELNGDPISPSEFKGKTVFINFWATWCGPCIQEMPTVEKAQASLKDKDVVFLIASNEDAEEIESFAQRRPFQFHYVRVVNLEELKFAALPTTYIFDKNGMLKFSETGARDWSQQDNLNLITQKQ